MTDNITKLEAEKVYHYKVVGMYYISGAAEYMSGLPPKTKLKLVPEPENQYDKYAVSVWHDERKLGYIPKYKNRPVFGAINDSALEVFCLLGKFIPGQDSYNAWGGGGGRDFQPDRADITVHTFSTDVDWRLKEFLPEDEVAH